MTRCRASLIFTPYDSLITVNLVDFILNLAALLLWINWRSILFDPLAQRRPATLMGTLRPAGRMASSEKRWHLLAAIGIALLLRFLVYRWVVPFWVGKLDLEVTVLSFRSDSTPGMLLFSFLSFGVTLGIFYLWLLLLSVLRGPDSIHRLVKMQLGRIDNWSVGAKLILPFFVAAFAWWFVSWPLDWLHIDPKPASVAQRLEESLLVGISCYLTWKYIAGALLILHLLSSYIYFGKHPIWNYATDVSQKLLLPLERLPLKVGRVDFAPVLGTAVIFVTAEFAGRGLWMLYGKLPF